MIEEAAMFDVSTRLNLRQCMEIFQQISNVRIATHSIHTQRSNNFFYPTYERTNA